MLMHSHAGQIFTLRRRLMHVNFELIFSAGAYVSEKKKNV